MDGYYFEIMKNRPWAWFAIFLAMAMELLYE